MTSVPSQFSETFGGLVLLASIFVLMLAFGVLRDRHAWLSAIALPSFGIGLLFAAHWMLVSSPGDNLDRILTRPIGALLLVVGIVFCSGATVGCVRCRPTLLGRLLHESPSLPAL